METLPYVPQTKIPWNKALNFHMDAKPKRAILIISYLVKKGVKPPFQVPEKV